MRFEDKVAVVTGGGSGIGHHTSLLFAHEGARVLVVDILGEKAETAGGVAEGLAADISSEGEAKHIMSRAELMASARCVHHSTSG